MIFPFENYPVPSLFGLRHLGESSRSSLAALLLKYVPVCVVTFGALLPVLIPIKCSKRAVLKPIEDIPPISGLCSTNERCDVVEVDGYWLGIVFVCDEFRSCVFLTCIAGLNDRQKVSLTTTLPIDVTVAGQVNSHDAQDSAVPYRINLLPIQHQR